jgi:hypothetical protein
VGGGMEDEERNENNTISQLPSNASFLLTLF